MELRRKSFIMPKVLRTRPANDPLKEWVYFVSTWIRTFRRSWWKEIHFRESNEDYASMFFMIVQVNKIYHMR
jgi:hypothetical protein